MKLNKKKVFVTALALCIIATISMGTLAWFSASDKVENKFWIASSDGTTVDKDFTIDIWEIDPESSAKEDVGHTYEDILPGDSLTKDVFVKNTGDYNQYIRVIVTISDAAAWIATVPDGVDPAEYATSIFGGFDDTKWTHIYNNLSEVQPGDPIPENLVYVLYYDGPVAPGTEINVFNTIEIPGTLTKAQADTFGGEFTVDVKAQAVQTENVVPATITAGKTAAWEAFNTVGLSIDD